ncbi:MAG: IS1595 family transposase [Thermoanaerobaculia bacterium]
MTPEKLTRRARELADAGEYVDAWRVIEPLTADVGSDIDNVGHWGTSYLDRAALTEYIQAGNDRKAAYYANAFVDASGLPLDGGSFAYTIQFAKNELPQYKRFWSMTAYTPESIELVPNALDKYVVASYKPGLVTAEDGFRNDLRPGRPAEDEHGQLAGINILDANPIWTYIVDMPTKTSRKNDGPYVPKTLEEAIVYFADEDNAFEYAVASRWPTGVFCPYCDTPDVAFIATRKKWRCRPCNKQFSVKVGTIFEDSPIRLGKWFSAIWMLINCKNGVSSYEIARALDVTQKTAWFLLHRVRAAIKAKSFDRKLAGTVETDECHIGGLMENMHKAKRDRVKAGRKANSATGKTIVQAVLERNGEVRAQILKSLALGPRVEFLNEHVEAGSNVMTDEGYDGKRMSDSTFVHGFVNHQREYVRGNIHTNGVENFWSLLQRTLSGTYVSVEPFHLSAYVDEQSFRFNLRKDTDGGRFLKALSGTTGVRLTYKDLTRAEQA